MYMTAGTAFTGITGTSYSSSGIIPPADVALALRNGWTPNDPGTQGYVEDNVTAAADFVTSTVASGSAVSLTTATAKTITSISVPAGSWDITGTVDFDPAATTTITELQAGVSLTTNTIAGQAGGSGLGTDPTTIFSQASAAPANIVSLRTGPVRLVVTAQTTVYLVAEGAFATSTLSAYGTLSARKV